MRAPIGGLPNGRATRTRSPAAFRPSPGKDRSKARRPTGRRESRRRSEEHTSELQSQSNLVCRLLLAKKTKPNLAFRHFSSTGCISYSQCHIFTSITSCDTDYNWHLLTRPCTDCLPFSPLPISQLAAP